MGKERIEEEEEKLDKGRRRKRVTRIRGASRTWGKGRKIRQRRMRNMNREVVGIEGKWKE